MLLFTIDQQQLRCFNGEMHSISTRFVEGQIGNIKF